MQRKQGVIFIFTKINSTEWMNSRNKAIQGRESTFLGNGKGSRWTTTVLFNKT